MLSHASENLIIIVKSYHCLYSYYVYRPIRSVTLLLCKRLYSYIIGLILLLYEIVDLQQSFI